MWGGTSLHGRTPYPLPRVSLTAEKVYVDKTTREYVRADHRNAVVAREEDGEAERARSERQRIKGALEGATARAGPGRS